ncbi:hypothetical protein [Yersinia mollaretii]|uniref:hypothetical protein n=1 Tax=Yersinia mollaretii TaxID=33060 RepID=UPI0011A4C7D2|nr:hypothetical protein [Yersinia mollaretii]
MHSINTGLAVSTKLIIDRNAGVCVSKYIKSGNTIPYGAFENAANDLKTLHQRNGYLRDIKPGNTAYDGKQVNFIDVDDRISKNTLDNHSTVKFKIHGEPCVYTENYITDNLLYEIYDKNDKISNNKDVAKYLKAADEYAFLLTIIAATTKSKVLREAIISPDPTRKIQRLSYVNRERVSDWIRYNTEFQHRDRVNLLLSAPDKYAVLNSDIYLSDMLLLSGK